MGGTSTRTAALEGTSTLLIEPWNVILLNDDIHSFDEVILQLIKATRCAPDIAAAIAWQVHTQGEAICFTGSKERCELVASILEEIRLKVRLEPA